MIFHYKKAALLLLCLATQLHAQQDLNTNYTPLKSKGRLPDVFTQDIKKVIKDDLTELSKSKEKDKGLKSTYYTQANYEIEKIVKSGNTLLSDEVTLYLNKLADVILKDKPSLRKEIRIYAFKSPVVNAYSYDKGYIYIDIGLIAQAETEAQLAYILCHEISHYVKKHNIDGYVQSKKIDRDNYSGKSSEDKLMEKCQYSKEHESEADIEGFKLFETTSYNFNQAEKAFDVLQYAHLPFELVEFKKRFLENDHFKIPDAYQLKEVSSIRNNANEDDSKSTHPNTAKRKLAIAELIRNRNNTGKVDYVLPAKDFEYIRDLARFELCRLYLKRRDYPNAFYAAYILQQKYPNNQYLAEVTGKCLYAVSLYNKGDLRYGSDSYLENGIPSHSDIESFPQQIYYLINKMPGSEWTIMSTSYIYRAHKRFPQSKVLTAVSDSMFALMKTTNWGIVDFVRSDKRAEPATPPLVKKDSTANTGTRSKTDMIASIQHENNFKNYDTAYYKEIFVDLFMTDTEFVSKFPASGSSETSGSSGFSDYEAKKRREDRSDEYYKGKRKSKKSKNLSNNIKIEKVLLLDPFYAQIDRSTDAIDVVASDLKQESLLDVVQLCAEKQNFQVVALDPGQLKPTEVEKMNDYSVINDWFTEKYDGERNSGNVPVMNTDQIEQVISKYGTSYVMRVAIITTRGGRKRTWFYGSIVDLNTQKEVFRMFETFNSKDARDLVNAKVYQLFFDLKHGN